VKRAPASGKQICNRALETPESDPKPLINYMKRIILLLGLAAFVSSSAFAGECCATKCAGSKASVCPVSKAGQQAKGAAGSVKERARATKAALMVASR